MRPRIIAIAAAALTVAFAYSSMPAPTQRAATANRRAAPLSHPTTEAGGVYIVSLREAKPRHVRPARPVSTVTAHRRGPATAHAPSPPRTTPDPPHHGGAVAALIRSVFGSQSGCALAIAWRESRFDPYARNPHSSASGVFQLTRIWWAGKWSFDPFSAWENVYHAHLMVQMYGWAPWNGCPSG